MFRKIMEGPKPWMFGHIYLPGGSENLGNPDYALKEGTKATLVGTLMRISDALVKFDGGRVMIVQGLERFHVKEVLQTEPCKMANVQLLPDSEVALSSLPLTSDESLYERCARDFDKWNMWETLPTTWHNPQVNGPRDITPLSNYNSQYFPDEIGGQAKSPRWNTRCGLPWTKCCI